LFEESRLVAGPFDPCDSSIHNHNGTIEGSFSWVVGHANDLNLTDGTGYRRLRSELNLYDLEEEGEKSINFKDLAVFIDEHWLEEILWP
jgi:hypothetical protein